MPFQEFTPPEQDWRQMPEQPHQPYINPDAHPYQSARRYGNIVAAVIAAQAGKNHYDLDGDPTKAVAVGAEAFVRWLVWGWAFLLGFATLLWTGFNFVTVFQPGGSLPLTSLCFPLALIAWPFSIGGTWVRNIDYCLFKRSFWYQHFDNVGRKIRQVCPWLRLDAYSVPMLYLPLAVCFVLPIIEVASGWKAV